MMGPNTASGHGSVSYITECQINFTLEVIRPIMKALQAQRSVLPVIGQKYDVVEVHAAAEQADIDNVQEMAKELVWSSGCTSWAVDEQTKRNSIMYPDFQYRYWLRSVFIAWKDFEFSKSQPLVGALEGKSLGMRGWFFVTAGMALLTSVLCRVS